MYVDLEFWTLLVLHKRAYQLIKKRIKQCLHCYNLLLYRTQLADTFPSLPRPCQWAMVVLMKNLNSYGRRNGSCSMLEIFVKTIYGTNF